MEIGKRFGDVVGRLCLETAVALALLPGASAAQQPARVYELGALQQAAIDTAVRVLEAQETATRRRLRAIEDRWIPRLQQALTELQFKLEEDEHNDAVRLRWAAANRTGAERGTGSKGKL